MRPALRLICALLGAPLCGSRAAAQATLPDLPTREDRILAVSTIWSEAKRSFAYWDRVPPTFDWDAQYRATLAEIIAVADFPSYVQVLRRFTASLRDGHTLVQAPQRVVDARYWDGPWVSLRAVGTRAIVANVDSVLADSIPIGSEVIAIDGVSTEQRIEQVKPYHAASTPHVWTSDVIQFSGRNGIGILAGRADAPMTLTLAHENGTRRTVSVRRDRGSRRSAWLRPPVALPLVEARPLADGMLYLAINSFNDRALAARLDSLRPMMERARGIVIDIRRNPGGNSGNGYLALQHHFGSRAFTTSAWRSRTEIQSRRAWGKQAVEQGDSTSENARHWRGVTWFQQPGERMEITSRVLDRSIPIAVLISRQTGSAAEDFLVALDGDPRFTIVGEPTNGSTGQPIFVGLPGGLTLWICTKRDAYPDGREFVGVGVQPQVLALETVESLRRGQDVALDAGMRVLRERAAR
ncbi:MAG: hypothetical protein JNJ98_03750 [Gemmatimonadetes bacterium]|nr:hypothetical protein [Gemmatimonadota bacterium]